MKPRTKRYLNATWVTFRSAIIAAVVELAIFFILIGLGQLGLLDLKTIVSVVVPEVGIGVFLYYFLGEHRRSRIDEVLNLMDAVEKFEHLTVFTFSVFPRPFHITYYYVENKTTGLVYNAPKYIEDMADRGLITKIKCKNEDEMNKCISDRKSTLTKNHEPSLADLRPFDKGKVDVKNSLYI